MSETERELSETEAEATGETVGEAKWAALRELERRFPGSTSRRSVRRPLGGRARPSRRRVRARAGDRKAGAVPPPCEAGDEEPDSPAARAARAPRPGRAPRSALRCGSTISEDDERLDRDVTGPELGLVIGKRGQTIDAIQYLATAIVFRGADERKSVLVDAAGYRDRRRATLEQQADRAASRSGRSRRGRSTLDPMSAVERKIVHVHLQEREDVETASEGNEPNRFVVVRPV